MSGIAKPVDHRSKRKVRNEKKKNNPIGFGRGLRSLLKGVEPRPHLSLGEAGQIERLGETGLVGANLAFIRRTAAATDESRACFESIGSYYKGQIKRAAG